MALARSLAARLDLVVADEPVSRLDVSLRLGVLNLMLSLNQRYGIGYLYITHDLAGARYVSSRIAVMYAGEIVEEAPSEAIVEEAQHPYTQLLMQAAPDPSGWNPMPNALLASRRIWPRRSEAVPSSFAVRTCMTGVMRNLPHFTTSPQAIASSVTGIRLDILPTANSGVSLASRLGHSAQFAHRSGPPGASYIFGKKELAFRISDQMTGRLDMLEVVSLYAAGYQKSFLPST